MASSGPAHVLRFPPLPSSPLAPAPPPPSQESLLMRVRARASPLPLPNTRPQGADHRHAICGSGAVARPPHSQHPKPTGLPDPEAAIFGFKSSNTFSRAASVSNSFLCPGSKNRGHSICPAVPVSPPAHPLIKLVPPPLCTDQSSRVSKKGRVGVQWLLSIEAPAQPTNPALLTNNISINGLISMGHMRPCRARNQEKHY